MQDVYSGAVVTIAATDSPSKSSGMLKDRNPGGLAPVPLEWKDISNKDNKTVTNISLQPGHLL